MLVFEIKLLYLQSRKQQKDIYTLLYMTTFVSYFFFYFYFYFISKVKREVVYIQ